MCINRVMLTHDVGMVVLRYLATTQERVGVCRRISKECREIVDSGVKRLKVDLQSFCSTANKLQCRFPKLEDLSFNLCSVGANGMLLQLAQHKPHLLQQLRSLDLQSCLGLEADVLLQLLQACHRLRKLTLPRLVDGVQSSAKEFLEVLCEHGTKLTHLAGAHCYIGASTIPQLAALTNLQSLDIGPGDSEHCELSAGRILQPLSSLTNLQCLQLGANASCHNSCTMAASLPKLSRLTFAYAEGYGISHEDIVPLTACSALKHLSLCTVTCSDQLLALLARCKVSSLQLDNNKFTASPGFAALLRQQLVNLQLKVNDRDIAAFADALPQFTGLRSLSVSIRRAAEDCSRLMPAIFRLPRLEQLSLGSNYNGLKEHELARLTLARALTSLTLSNHFSNVTLVKMLCFTPQLRQLHLVSLSLVDDEGLSWVAATCNHLRSVHLELMRWVNAAGVAAVAAGPHVTRVVVEGCRNVLTEDCHEVMRCMNKLDLEIVKLK